MPTKRLPGYLLNAVPNIALASTEYLSAYASLVLQSIDTDDGQIADARAQLILLNERLETEVGKVTDTPAKDLFGILTTLQTLRDEVTPLVSGFPEMHEVADDAGRILCAVNAMAEVGRRAAGRECLVKKIVGSEAA
ncbi:hypothetical protein FG93_04319 [Bosea sp. LC85]|uniref:hypothetical protein n=1 Tax=Bosea sp. LC85 TaxID=1502851 RepID=UPI0004E2C0C4|nr:hypothetical protein [Bosea sp. LC85]KFC66837.1 hypothetical protein FG93_04319 [Bosea sp. LC85]